MSNSQLITELRKLEAQKSRLQDTLILYDDWQSNSTRASKRTALTFAVVLSVAYFVGVPLNSVPLFGYSVADIPNETATRNFLISLIAISASSLVLYWIGFWIDRGKKTLKRQPVYHQAKQLRETVEKVCQLVKADTPKEGLRKALESLEHDILKNDLRHALNPVFAYVSDYKSITARRLSARDCMDRIEFGGITILAAVGLWGVIRQLCDLLNAQ